MTLEDQVFARAAQMGGAMDDREEALLRVLSRSACVTMRARLRDGITPEDCGTDFTAAAGLYALAALEETGADAGVERFSAGDLTVQRAAVSERARSLRDQADRMMLPYAVAGFFFAGV